MTSGVSHPRLDGVYVAPDVYSAHVFRFLADDHLLKVALVDDDWDTNPPPDWFPEWLNVEWAEENGGLVQLDRQGDQLVATIPVSDGKHTTFRFSWDDETLVVDWDSTFSGESGRWESRFHRVPEAIADAW